MTTELPPLESVPAAVLPLASKDTATIEANASPGPKAAREAPPATVSTTQSGILKLIDRSKLLAAFISVLAASIAPVTAFITKGAERDLKALEQRHATEHQAAQQQHEFEQDFLKNAVAPDPQAPQSLNAYFRRDVLRFYAAVLAKGPLKDFAGQELDRITNELAATETAERDRADAAKKFADMQAQAARLAQERDSLKGAGATNAAALAKVTSNLRAKEAELEGARQSAQDANAHAEELKGLLQRNIAAAGPCPAASRLIAGGGNDEKAQLACAATAPRDASKLWHAQLEGRQISCGCLPK